MNLFFMLYLTKVTFILSLLEENQPLDDYRKIFEISRIFLGCPLFYWAHFLSPGPMHHARRMSKVIDERVFSTFWQLKEAVSCDMN